MYDSKTQERRLCCRYILEMISFVVDIFVCCRYILEMMFLLS